MNNRYRNNDNYGRGYGDNKSRFKSVRRNDERPQKSLHENEQKFNYASLASKLLDNDDIQIKNEEVIYFDSSESSDSENEIIYSSRFLSYKTTGIFR
jgi:type IV secretory pathway VirB4 component